MKYKGLYLNLDRNPERRARIEGELTRCGLAGYGRFPATSGNAMNYPNPGLKLGEIGCFTSHAKLLEANQQSSLPLHVIEDDIVLSSQTGAVLDWVIDSGHLDKFDMVYTDVSVPLLNDACQSYKNLYDASVKRNEAGRIESVRFSVVDLRTLIFGSTCSFLVNPRAIGKLGTLLEAALRQGAPQPVDLYLRTLCQQGAINVGCIFPFVTSIQMADSLLSNIEKPPDEVPAVAANLLRHSFFIDCDWTACLRHAERLFPQPAKDDTHRQMMLRLLGYTLTPDYRQC